MQPSGNTQNHITLKCRKSGKPVIVLDVGGVLVDFDLKPLIRALSENRGESVSLPPLSAMDRLFLPVQTGKASFNDIVPELNAFLKVSIPPEEWRDLLCSIFTGEMQGMREMLTELKRDFYLVGLTNTIEPHWTFVLQTYEILHLLDGCIVSYVEGLAKPDPAIYQRVMDRYCNGGLPYFHTDDLPEYVEAARRLGWRSQVFRNALQFKNELLGGRGAHPEQDENGRR